MLSKLRSRISYANAVASLALFIALGGTSYGLATGSIGSREIKNNAVRSKDIRNTQVRSADVRNFSLLARDFKRGQLPAGAQGAAGPEGPPGPTFADVDGVLNAPISPEQPSPSVPSHSYSFAIPAAGQVLLEVRTRLSVTCTIGVAIVGIYVDGVPLPQSSRLIGGASEERSFAGLTTVLAPGQHAAVLLATCPDGDFTTGSATNDAIWSALLIGG